MAEVCLVPRTRRAVWPGDLLAPPTVAPTLGSTYRRFTAPEVPPRRLISKETNATNWRRRVREKEVEARRRSAYRFGTIRATSEETWLFERLFESRRCSDSDRFDRGHSHCCVFEHWLG